MLGNGAETDEGIGRRSQGPCDEYPAAFHTVSWMQGENLGATVFGLAFCLRWSVNRID